MDKNNSELFSRHISLERFGVEAQEKLLNADICVVGCGGLGSAALPYLVCAGIGRITFIDLGGVELSNLQRQQLYGLDDIGVEKTEAALQHLQRINHSSEFTAVKSFITEDNIDEIIGDKFELVIDCTDNFTVRYLLADYLWKKKTTLLSAAILEYTGHIFTLINENDNPCLRCLVPEPPVNYKGASEVGVLGPAVGVMGSMQAVEAVKIISGVGDILENSFLSFDFLQMRINKMQREKDQECKFCS